MARSVHRVFVSYTGRDLTQHADAVASVIRRLEWIAIDHRYWSPNGRPSVSECKRNIESCDMLVVLIAHRYGWVPTTQEGGDGYKSITWIEYEHARAKGLEIIPFVVDEQAPWPATLIEAVDHPESREPLRAFKQAVQSGLAASFSNPRSLEATLAIALADAADRLESSRSRSENALAWGASGCASDAEFCHALQVWGDRLKDPAWTMLTPPFLFGRSLRIDECFAELHLVPMGELVENDDLETQILSGSLQDGRGTLPKAYLRAQSSASMLSSLRRRTIIVGAPGAGKTTFAMWLAQRIQSGGVPPFDTAFVVPLGAFAREFRANPTTTLVQYFLARQVGLSRSEARRIEARILEDLTSGSASNGGAIASPILILDGWDELPDDLRFGVLRVGKTTGQVFGSWLAG